MRHHNGGQLDRCQWWHSAEDHLCTIIVGVMQLEVLMDYQYMWDVLTVPRP